jgi:CheY-like chemotaxis protein
LLAWQPGAELWPVKVDPSQVDQIVANLCVNARDAIRGAGRVEIETANVTFDARYCAAHPGFLPGDYVRLNVRDDGCGMDEEAQSHAFEPFFTTKEPGKGTGLGLAAVHGAVSQNQGFVQLTSTPGVGTTFAIHLPRHARPADGAPRPLAAGPAPRGNETVLIVEDEPAILRLSRRVLAGQGYTVLCASSPGEAIRMAREHAGEIHVLVTDVVMPELNGRDLAETLIPMRPALKLLFMSGYTADIIAANGVLGEGVSFLQKPFSATELAAKVRAVLDGAGGRDAARAR